MHMHTVTLRQSQRLHYALLLNRQIFAQVKQLIVTNALCYQLPERNITVFKRLRNMVNDNELSEVKIDE